MYTTNSLYNDCFGLKVVLVSNCPESEVPMQSDRSGWLQIALSLLRECPYIKCPQEEKLL